MEYLIPYHVYADSAGWITRPAWDVFIQQTRHSWHAQLLDPDQSRPYSVHYAQCLAQVGAVDLQPDTDIIHFRSEHHLTLFLLRYSA
jgi:hypothetical protein